MNDINDVKNRIKERKKGKYKKKLNDNHFSKFYNFMIKSMVIMFVLLAVFTYLKITPEGNYINDHVLAKKNLESLVSWVNNQFYSFFPNNNLVSVSSVVEYNHLKDNLYTNNSNEVVNFQKGRVIYKGEQELLGKYIIIMLQDNIEITFGNMTDTFVSEYDNVDKGTVIGTYSDNLIIIFSHNGKEIDYDTFKELVK